MFGKRSFTEHPAPTEDCYFRMMAAQEVGRSCGFATGFPGNPDGGRRAITLSDKR